MPQTHYPRLERSLMAMGATLLVSLVLLAILTYRLVWDVVDAGRWVAHTQEVRAELEALIGDLSHAETNQRGFLLTGDAGYLDLYSEGLAQSRERYVRLRALTADNPRQQARFPDLDAHIGERLRLTDQAIAAMRASPEEAIRIVRTNRGKEEMAAIRALIGDMRAEENRLLTTRSADLEEIQRRTFAIVLFVIAATGVVMILLLAYLRANIRRYHKLALSLSRITEYKDLLLKEIHHRLNNVLQLVYSILQLQSRGLVPDARRPFEESMRRVRAVGRAHEPVYGADSASDVPLRALLAVTLKDALSAAGRRSDSAEIVIEADGMAVGIDLAVPLGLMLSEVAAVLAAAAVGLPILTLAAKASTDGRTIAVTLSHNVPHAFEGAQNGQDTMLVRGLAEQLDAEFQASAHSIRIVFAAKPVAATPAAAASEQ